MYKSLLIIIILVFVLTILFAFLIWLQLGKFAEKALAAKRRQEEYLAELNAKNPTHQAILKTDTGWDDPDDEDRSSWI